MATHDDDDDLFADLYGDEEETKPTETKPASATAVPVPPPSVAAPIVAAAESSVGDVAAQLSAVTKAHDPRLPPPVSQNDSQQQQHQQSAPAQQPSTPVPEMPQMPQMPQAPPPQQQTQQGYQSNYNVKEDGKMFIGGLNWETTDESMREYFEQFGTVTDCMVMRDGATGRSRGFGFLTFADPASVTDVVSKEHFLNGKIIDPKRAVPRDEQEKTAKMFVGGVPPDCDEEQFSNFFGQFGRVVDATLMMDKDTGRPRGFGFVTFDSGEAVERAMVTPFLQINGKTIEVKRATPKGGQDRNARGAGTYNAQGGFGSQDNASTAAAYGGMTPAMMAQYYQRMQQWMAQMQAMGRGQAAQGMMGMNPMMNPMMMQQMQQMQQMNQGGGVGGYPQQQGQMPQQQQQQQPQQQQQYGSQSPYAQGDDQQQQQQQDQAGGDGDDQQDARPPIDAPSGPSAGSYRGGSGNGGGGRGGYQDRGGNGYQDRGGRYDRGGGRGGYQDRGGRGRGRGGFRGGQSRFDPYAR